MKKLGATSSRYFHGSLLAVHYECRARLSDIAGARGDGQLMAVDRLLSPIAHYGEKFIGRTLGVGLAAVK